MEDFHEQMEIPAEGSFAQSLKSPLSYAMADPEWITYYKHFPSDSLLGTVQAIKQLPQRQEKDSHIRPSTAKYRM